MEMIKTEVKVEESQNKSVSDDFQQLSELQLALVGGGIGSVVFG